MRLYNTKTLQVEPFHPIIENQVSMYVCGPTVYNHAHIGNARPVIVFDTLRRLFETLGYRVTYVSNFTDVDDRIIQQALQEGVKESEISTRYILAYTELLKNLNTLYPSASPKVTETMDAIIHFIKDLEDQGFAYEVGGDVFFRVTKVQEYGQMSHQNIEELHVGARIEENSKKENPLDFALWKNTEDGIKWDSPWGQGRPGWHTECVVMITQEFKRNLIDIHGGGQDLRFPHHENEVAQCRALYHTDLANVWMHNGTVNVNGAKMSKSLGNFRLAKEVLAQYGTNLVRWVMLSVHYRMDLNFSEEVFASSQKELEKVKSALNQASLLLSLEEERYPEEADLEKMTPFLNQMSDDLNTPNGYTEIFEAVKNLNQQIRQKEKDFSLIASWTVALEKMLWVLGIEFPRITLTDSQKEVYQKWTQAKQDKDFALADKLRAQLQEEGILS